MRKKTSKMAIPTPDLDLRGTVCPMAFVKLRLHADGQPVGSTFEALFEETPANEPLERSIQGVGHQIVAVRQIDGSDPALKMITVKIQG